jgi:NADH-quinone oxidoreductase subunit L
MNYIVALIPLFPLLGFLAIGLNYKRLPKKVTSIIGPGSVFISFILSILVFANIVQTSQPISVGIYDWISVGDFTISFAFLADQLTAVMLLVVTGVGFLIHVYSIGYMNQDEGYNRFFAYMNLFVFSMLLLVLGSNYVILFIGWEGVGLCSYLLIGFWFKNTEYNNAAKKAFIMNRIGDLGFLLGIFLIYDIFGSLDYSTVFSEAAVYAGCPCGIYWIAILLFVGAIGKSAQIPLYTWLPDAMAGPTPVSALIHAATMVTAGVYMIARSGILYAFAPESLTVVASIGIITALFAASIALYQNDIKKILAYSTISQLGYMFVGLGVGAFTGAIFHLVTHAFFKALLFLGAGSIIHALSGEQDITKMGGLKKYLPKTYITFLVATLAIAGIPPLSGFFSKDEILIGAFNFNIFFWILGLIGAVLTTFYMFRLLFLTFFKSFRGSEDQKKHLGEHYPSMNIPLIILAVLSALGGFIGIPELFGGEHYLSYFLNPVFEPAQKMLQLHHQTSHFTEYTLIGITVFATVLAIFLAYDKFYKKGIIPTESVAKTNIIAKLAAQKFYVDEIYSKIINSPVLWLSGFLHKIVEVKIIDNLVNKLGDLIFITGNKLRAIQTGTTGFYLLVMVLGIIALLVVNLFNL